MESEVNVGILKQAVEKNELDIKEMIEATKNVVTHYEIDRPSTYIAVRKVGYNGFTVSFTLFKPSGEWSVNGSNELPEGLEFMLNRWGVQSESDSCFYEASKAYSHWKYGK
jgi:hypothetical protein